jgi:site-specific recombinase XerD
LSDAVAGIVVAGTTSLPSLFTVRPETRKRLRDFFSSHIRNRNTRRAYTEAVRQFAAFCAELGPAELEQVEAIHVAAFVERQLQTNSRPTVKLRLAALRMLFDWMVVGHPSARNWENASRICAATRSVPAFSS